MHPTSTAQDALRLVRTAATNIESARVFLAHDAQRLALLASAIGDCRRSPEVQAALQATRAQMAELSALLETERVSLATLGAQCMGLVQAEQRRTAAASVRLLDNAIQGLEAAGQRKPRAKPRAKAAAKPAARRVPVARRIGSVGQKRKAGVSIEEID